MISYNFTFCSYIVYVWYYEIVSLFFWWNCILLFVIIYILFPLVKWAQKKLLYFIIFNYLNYFYYFPIGIVFATILERKFGFGLTWQKVRFPLFCCFQYYYRQKFIFNFKNDYEPCSHPYFTVFFLHEIHLFFFLF